MKITLIVFLACSHWLLKLIRFPSAVHLRAEQWLPHANFLQFTEKQKKKNFCGLVFHLCSVH